MWDLIIVKIEEKLSDMFIKNNNKNVGPVLNLYEGE